MMLNFLSSEPELAIGAGITILVWLILIVTDIRRRAKGEHRRTTSPFPQWSWTFLILWTLAIVALWSWMASGRSLTELGFTLGSGGKLGWQLGLAWGMSIAFVAGQLIQLVMILRSEKMQAEVRDMFFASGDYDQVMPRRRKDVWGFQILAVTAGITEEIVFRGFLIGLFAMFIPLWPAAGLALALFVIGHAYQGWKGMARILPISFVLTLVFVLSGSLWPGILLHIFVDVLGGFIAWKLLPDEGYFELDRAQDIDNAQPIG